MLARWKAARGAVTYRTAILDRAHPLLGRLSRELDDLVCLVRRDLLAHQLSRRDTAQLERDNGTIADLHPPQ